MAAHAADRPTYSVPPPVPPIAALVLITILDLTLPVPFLPRGVPEGVGIPLVVAGVGLWGWGMASLSREGESPSPFTPTERLLTEGALRTSRNPMYTGRGIGLLAWRCSSTPRPGLRWLRPWRSPRTAWFGRRSATWRRSSATTTGSTARASVAGCSRERTGSALRARDRTRSARPFALASMRASGGEVRDARSGRRGSARPVPTRRSLRLDRCRRLSWAALPVGRRPIGASRLSWRRGPRPH
jgi:hypothetical protein